MPARRERSPFLSRIALVTPTARFPLRAPAPAAAGARLPSLASEAMRWSYVVRSRARWRDSPEANLRHQADAAATLAAFGLGDDALRAIAAAGRVVVTMPYAAEALGWEGRIFPWEFVLARATRRFRPGGAPRLTVMRQLEVRDLPPPAPRALAGRVLFVHNFPGARGRASDGEAERIRAACGLAADDTRWRLLVDPSLAELAGTCAAFRPEIVHLSGLDNHQGVALLAESSGDAAPVARGDELRSAGDCLRDDRGVIDGVLMHRDDGVPAMIAPQELGLALAGDGDAPPFFVGLNLWNSAARIAPLLLPAGALASLGFQDAFDDALGAWFFETLYAALRARDGNLPAAFDAAWQATRRQDDLAPGTGIALWARAPLVARPRLRPAAAPLAVPLERAAATAAEVVALIEPRDEFNYAELHNQGGPAAAQNRSALFERFELRGEVTEPPARVEVQVELHCGPERARYDAEIALTQPRQSLHGRIAVPLTASLIRSVSEAVVSSLFVQVTCAGRVVHRDTTAIRLLPVDQWLDNHLSGPWLPSFVLPRDPAVERAVRAAQRYVRVIRDDPAAGFEGYQSATSDDAASLESVDLQVEAIWAALLHEWQLGYINPPPTYNRALDSQRLRTPSAVFAGRMGTCIDLALLFAACLELVDILPVIFLLDGHALPGYWRHRDFQLAWRAVNDVTAATAPGDAERTGSAGAQSRPWRVGRPGWREVSQAIRDGRLAPLETVRLTEHCGFREAREAGVEALAHRRDFDSILDIAIAREHQVTPLPILPGDGR